MSAKLAKVASVIGLSTFKHTLGGVPLAAGYGFSFWEIVLTTCIGGLLGVLFFLFLASSLQALIKTYFPRKKTPKKFSKRNRFIVRVKKNFGLAGIAFITPWFLSIPLGTIISLGIYKDKKKIFLFQGLSVVVWSVIGAGIASPIASLFANA